MYTRWTKLLLSVLLPVSLGACTRMPTPIASRWSVGTADVNAALSIARPAAADAPGSSVEGSGPLTLGGAWSLVLSHSPELAAAAMEIDWRKAMSENAAAIPNPELEMSTENFGGSNETSGFDVAETTLQIAQTIELGGKRAARRRLARDKRQTARHEFADDLLRVGRDTRIAYIEVVRAQRRVDTVAELVDAARETFDTMGDDAAASAAARVEVSQAEIELRHAQSEHRRARYELAALWGEEPRFATVVDTLDEPAPLPRLTALVDRIDSHPRIAAARAVLAAAEAGRDLARAGAVPDITPSFGARRFHESDETAFVVGLSLPLPLFDRKSGERRAARIRARQAREALRSVEIEVRSRLLQAHEALSAAHNEADVLRTEILPEARRAFEDAADSHRHGLLGRPVVLGARRAWRDVEGRAIDALAACARWRAEVDRWSGSPAR